MKGPGADRAGRLRRVDRAAFALGAAMTLGLGAVAGRVAQLQVAPGPRLSAFLDDRTSLTTHRAPRGDLLDRRGRMLAATTFGARVFLDLTAVEHPLGPALVRIAAAAGVDENDLGRRASAALARHRARMDAGRAGLRFAPITGVLDDVRAKAVRGLGLPGVHLETRAVREALGAPSVAPIVGKVGFEGGGVAGAEVLFDDELQPTAGAIRYVRDHMARPMWVSEAGLTPPRRGENVRLSLDLAVQSIAAEELRRGVEQADAAGGRVIVADPATGELLAMAQHVREVEGLVDSDPGAAPASGERARYRVVPDNDPAEPALARNRCVEDVYEPGSVFKPFVWASITERGGARPDETFATHAGVWKVPGIGRTLHDVTKADEMTWREVLLYSSNIGMAQGALRLSHAELRADLRRFGFGEPTRLGLAGESGGLVTSAKAWSAYTQTSVCMGQEVAVTPVQLVRAFSVFARNGELAGTLPALRLRAISTGQAAQQLRDLVLPPEVAYLTRDILAGVGERMRTRFGQLFPDEPDGRYTLFGKSGTAQVAKPTGGGYLEDQYISSFVAGAPLEAPRIVVLVIIEDPGPGRIAMRAHYGSPAAGPVVLRIVDRVLAYQGVAPDRAGDGPRTE